MLILTNSVRKFAIMLAVCISSALSAQARVDIVQIWQNFVASRDAAQQCGGISEDTEEHFLVNLNIVTMRAVQAMLDRNPSFSQDDILKEEKRVLDGINEKVTNEIKQNGCSSTNIQQLLRLYKMHSTMQL